MLKAIRYALATICFALSVACLALWGWTHFDASRAQQASRYSSRISLHFQAYGGVAFIAPREIPVGAGFPHTWQFTNRTVDERALRAFYNAIEQHGTFGQSNGSVFFPLWYPALVFALAGIAALRLGRRFTLRSAIIATTVVVVLLGVVVAL